MPDSGAMSARHGTARRSTGTRDETKGMIGRPDKVHMTASLLW
jgi:hypothetical protein